MNNNFHLIRDDDKPCKWCSPHQIEKIKAGEVKNMESIDLYAIIEGQADSKMRSYCRKQPESESC